MSQVELLENWTLRKRLTSRKLIKACLVEEKGRKQDWTKGQNKLQRSLNTCLSPSGISEDVITIQVVQSSSKRVGPLHLPIYQSITAYKKLWEEGVTLEKAYLSIASVDNPYKRLSREGFQLAALPEAESLYS